MAKNQPTAPLCGAKMRQIAPLGAGTLGWVTLLDPSTFKVHFSALFVLLCTFFTVCRVQGQAGFVQLHKTSLPLHSAGSAQKCKKVHESALYFCAFSCSRARKAGFVQLHKTSVPCATAACRIFICKLCTLCTA